MIRALRHTVYVLLLLILAACSKQEETPHLEVSPEQIRLSNEAGAAAAFTVTANVAWTMTHEAEGFRVTQGATTAGRTPVTVTAVATNESMQSRELGAITIHSRLGDMRVGVFQKPAIAAQTMLLYMPGRSLLDFYKHNIESVSSAVSHRVPGDGRIVVCYQPDNHRSAVLQEIYYDALSNRCETATLKRYESFNAGSEVSVRQLFEDAAELAPARRYGLIIGCHGKAWIPAASGTIPYSATSQADDVWTPAPDAKPTRSFGDSGYELDIPALASILSSLTLRFDYLIFDDCFMANIETLYDLRGAVDRVVASPCEIMGAGFPYDRVLPHLFAEQGASHDLEKACWEFWNFYENDWASQPSNEQSGCISMAVMSELDGLAEVMRRINDNGKQPFEISELQYYKGGSTPLFYDLGHYVTLSCGDPALVDEFMTQLDRAFPASCRLHTAKFYSQYNNALNPVHFYTGVSVSEPSTRFAAENRQTSWYRETH